MNDPETDPRQRIALFRYGVIAELLHRPPEAKGLYKHLAEKAARDYTIPGTRPHPHCRRDPARLAPGLPARRLRRAVAQAPRRPRPGACLARRGGRGAARRQGGQSQALGAVGHPRGPQIARGPGGPAAAALHRASPARPPWPDGQVQGGPGRARPPPLRLRPGRGAVDERCDARTERDGGRSHQAQDLPDRLPRRRHPGRPPRRLCALGEHRHLPAGAPPGDPETRPAGPALYGQRRELSLPTSGAGVCEAGHRLDPCPPVPPPGQG